MHDMFRLCFLPKCEVDAVVFFILSVKFAGIFQRFLDITARQFAIVELLRVFRHIEVNRAVAFVSETGLQYFINKFNLLDNVS